MVSDDVEENDESDLTELVIEEGEGFEVFQDVGEEEWEEGEDNVEEERIEEEELFSS